MPEDKSNGRNRYRFVTIAIFDLWSVIHSWHRREWRRMGFHWLEIHKNSQTSSKVKNAIPVFSLCHGYLGANTLLRQPKEGSLTDLIHFQVFLSTFSGPKDNTELIHLPAIKFLWMGCILNWSASTCNYHVTGYLSGCISEVLFIPIHLTFKPVRWTHNKKIKQKRKKGIINQKLCF